MRKIVGWLLLLVGAFLVVTWLLLLVVAPGKAERTPLNVNTTTWLTGQAKHLDPASGKVLDDPVRILSINRADPKVSTGTYAAFVASTCVNVDSDLPKGDKCLGNDDPRLITNSTDVFATDRHTGMATGKLDLGAKATPHKGLVNKWPFNTVKKDYPYWDGVLGETVTAKYSGTQKIDGLNTYVYKISVPSTPATVISDLKGTYSFDSTVNIEPRTGSIIKQVQHQVRTLEDGTTVLDMSVAYTKDQVKKNVDEANSNRALLSLVGAGSFKAWLIGVVGAILIAIGAVLALRGARANGAGPRTNTASPKTPEPV